VSAERCHQVGGEGPSDLLVLVENADKLLPIDSTDRTTSDSEKSASRGKAPPLIPHEGVGLWAVMDPAMAAARLLV
jgi:hypothetical protein